MRTKTNTVITIVVAVVILSIFAVRGHRVSYPETLATERQPPDEPAHIVRLVEHFEQLAGRSRHGVSVRGQPPKYHGCFTALFEVANNLDDSLVTELFQPGAKFPALVRFANAGGGSDSEPDLQTLAIKLFGTPGGALADNSSAQDFVLFSHPVFLFDDVEAYADGLIRFADGQPKKFLYQSFNPQITAYRIAQRMLVRHDDLLANRWWSMVPYQYGEGRAAKYSAKPCRRRDPSRAHYGEHYLQERLAQSIENAPVCFEFMVQMQSDPQLMPIENASIEWDEYLSPFQPVAVITIPQQHIEDESTAACVNRDFDRWRTLPAHRPLGGINRAHRVVHQRIKSGASVPGDTRKSENRLQD